jgi:hypothetical protein
MGVTTFGVVSGQQITGDDSAQRLQPGTIYVYRTKESARPFSSWSLVQYVKFGVAVNKGDAVCSNDGTDSEQVEIASVVNGMHCAGFRGIAAATHTTASFFGFTYIGGYCPFARFSSTVASNVGVSLSGSTAGRLVGLLSGQFNATAGQTSTHGTMARIMALTLGAASNASTDGTSVRLTSIWY